MNRNDLKNEYFEWIYSLMCEGRYSENISYRKLLLCLHETEFMYINKNDKNRAEDGVNLRYRFSLWYGFKNVPSCLNGPCSVLEMLAALAIRCEETIMDDPQIGDRTGQWFWGMIANLGLGSMSDSLFDDLYVGETVARFLNRDYEPNGRGGLFVVRNCTRDLRYVDIWTQMCWYLDNFI